MKPLIILRNLFLYLLCTLIISLNSVLIYETISEIKTIKGIWTIWFPIIMICWSIKILLDLRKE